MRLENIIIAITVAVIAVTSVNNIVTVRKFELIGLIATAIIMAVTVAMDFLKSKKQ